MKISIERLKQIIKEELEAHALSEQEEDTRGGDDDPESVEDVDYSTWKKQVRLAKQGKVFLRRNNGWWHLTYLLQKASPSAKELNPKSRKSRKLVAQMVKKMQGGKSTLVVGRDYGRIINYLDLHIMRKQSQGERGGKDKNYNAVLMDPRNFDKRNEANAYKLYVQAAKNRIKHGYPGWVPTTDSMFLNPSHEYFGLTTLEMNRVHDMGVKSKPVPARDDPGRGYEWAFISVPNREQARKAMRAWLNSWQKKTGVKLPFDVAGDAPGAPSTESTLGTKKYGPGGEVVSADTPAKKGRFESEEEKQRYIVARRMFSDKRPRELMKMVKDSLASHPGMDHKTALRLVGGE